MQWHNWMDNREEGGLRIGLRAFADGDFKEYDVKPVWKVWQAADTDKEDEVFKPYLDVIGISNWDGLIHTVNSASRQYVIRRPSDSGRVAASSMWYRP